MLTAQGLTKAVGNVLGTSGWVEISQDRIDAFADVTEDWHGIHLDPDAGRAAGFGGTVAHGFLTLSMLSMMSYAALPDVENQKGSVNYGFDRIRFIAPVPAGARLRAHFTLADVLPRGTALMLRLEVTVEIDGADRPALNADWRILLLF